MEITTREEVERQHREWRLERLAAEARDAESSRREYEPSVERLYPRVQGIGGNLGLFRR